MTIDVNFHGVRHIHAESFQSGGRRSHGWVTVKFTDKDGTETETAIFFDNFLLGGLVAKAINEAQIEFTRRLNESLDKLVAEGEDK